MDAEDDPTLLTSPIKRRLVGRLFVIGGPVGLAIAILLSLWVSQQRVTHSVIVQIEPRWVPGEDLALRVQVAPESMQAPGPPAVEAAVEQGGRRHALRAPTPVGRAGLAQGRITVPELALGPAVLHVRIEAEPFAPRDEAIPIEVEAERGPRASVHVMSSSASQYADDSDEQPTGVGIDVRPLGRVIAGFDNELLLRVTDAEGAPWSGPAVVRLLDGELGGARGLTDAPPVVWRGRTDPAGLAAFGGLLSSEVLRLRVQLLAEDDPERVVHERKIRLVSFAGAVQLRAAPRRVSAGGELEVQAAGLSGTRPVFVDVFGPDGAWIDTFNPPIEGREPARAWSVPSSGSGLVQLEAYHFTNDPGESTAVARIEVHAPGADDSLSSALRWQRERLLVPRADRAWDQAREEGYLRALAEAKLSPITRASARRWLLGTLPVEVRGPPTAMRSRERDLAAMARYRRGWIVGLRIFMLGGGALFLLAMTILMLRTHQRDAAATLEQLQSGAEGEERARLEAHVRASQRAARWRGLLVIGAMAIGLCSAFLLLENLVWDL